MAIFETSLTIGTFDGLHLGHQAILKALTGKRVVVTFQNHPHTILAKGSPPLLMFPSKRLELLRRSVDEVYELPFTRALSQLTARDFLLHIMEHIPFTHLVLGHDAVLGYNREGTAERIKELAEELGFKVSYLPPTTANGQVVSSSLIRQALQEGDLSEVSQLLGRPYSVKGIVAQGAGAGKSLGYPTANIAVSELALPPHGVYAVSVEGKRAIANLGHAPTLHLGRPVILEVHVLETDENLYGKEIEVVFERFMRPEKSFESVDALQEQIRADVAERLEMANCL